MGQAVVTKRIAFLDFLSRRRGVTSARSVGEGVVDRFGEDYETTSAERSGLLSHMEDEGVVRARKPRASERETAQQRLVYVITAKGKREVKVARKQARLLVRVKSAA